MPSPTTLTLQNQGLSSTTRCRRAASSLPGPALKERNKRLPTSAPLKQPKVPEPSPTAASRAALKRSKSGPNLSDSDQARAEPWVA